MSFLAKLVSETAEGDNVRSTYAKPNLAAHRQWVSRPEFEGGTVRGDRVLITWGPDAGRKGAIVRYGPGDSFLVAVDAVVRERTGIAAECVRYWLNK